MNNTDLSKRLLKDDEKKIIDKKSAPNGFISRSQLNAFICWKICCSIVELEECVIISCLLATLTPLYFNFI